MPINNDSLISKATTNSTSDRNTNGSLIHNITAATAHALVQAVGQLMSPVASAEGYQSADDRADAPAHKSHSAHNAHVSGYVPFSPWEKLAIMAGGAGLVALTILVVACVVFPVCCLHRKCCNGKVIMFYC